MTLRYYQREAIDATYRFFTDRPSENPCIVLPTGAGKTHVIVQMCSDVQRWGGRVLILAHVKELLDQAYTKIVESGLQDVGLYSAGLNRRDQDNSIVVAGIQSVYRRGLEMCGSRPFNMVIVDEAHRIPVEGNGMYVQLLSDLKAANPKLKIVGLTATPYRTGEGYVCSESHFLNAISYEANIRELIAGGYLCKLISKRSKQEVDMTGVKVSGDFVASEMEDRFNSDSQLVLGAVLELLKLTEDRRKVLIFCCGIAHASNVAGMIDSAGQSVRLVTSEHGGRDKAIEAFKAGKCKYLVNVNVLCEGFDATDIDCVVLLRATFSPGLYYQMLGRGLRIDSKKQDCLVLDFGGNIQRHGPIDQLYITKKGKGNVDGEAPVKPCPECDLMVHAGLLVCSGCGYEFPPRDPNHEQQADSLEPIGGSPEVYEVASVGYSLHVKKGNEDGPKSMRVTYYDGGMKAIADEWICVEHTGFAFEKAARWWSLRTNTKMPKDAESAVNFANRGGLAEASEIKIKRIPGKRWVEIVDYELGDPIDPSEVAGEEELIMGVFEEEEIPF